MTINAIHGAQHHDEVLLLLNEYVDLARVRGRRQLFPAQQPVLPLSDSHAVRAQFEFLLRELDAASRNLDDYTRDILHEAVHVFGAALEQLLRLERLQHAQIAA
jgi:hypothetical protein